MCKNCGKEYYGTIHKTGEHHYCSDECRNKVHNTNSRNNIIAKRQKKLSEGEEGYDYITCSCGNVSVDGGLDYCRRVFKDMENWIDTSILEDDTSKQSYEETIEGDVNNGKTL